jgi:type VI secretion system protein ImpA
MPDTLVNGSDVPSPVDHWLLPLEGAEPCGPNVEYDADFLELIASAGKPATQFAPAEPPAWPRVRELAESLMERTRDLRVAVWWGRSGLNLDGVAALPATLALLHGLMDRFWGPLHPAPDADDPDALIRVSAIAGLDRLSGLLGDVRDAALSKDRRLSGLRVRDVEVALGKLAVRTGETVHTQGQIEGRLAEAADVAADLARQVDASRASLAQLRALMNERFRSDLVVDLKTFENMLSTVRQVLPAPTEPLADLEPDPLAADAPDSGSLAAPGPASARRSAAGVYSIGSRQDAMRAIELVCAYLERSEPTNPAQLFLRRAGRVIDMNFLQLVDELAPDALKDVSRILGVDPSTINNEQ